MSELQKIKQKMKSNKPKFIRQDTHKKKKLAKIWRKPRGIDSKKRLMKNNRVMVKPGYGTPDLLRGKDKSGKEIILICSVKEIERLDPKKHSVIVSKKLGQKNKIKIFEELLKNKISLHNISDVEKHLADKKSQFEAKKKEKQIKKKEPEKEVKSKESIEDKLDDEEKKKLEKKEIDRLLTKKF